MQINMEIYITNINMFKYNYLLEIIVSKVDLHHQYLLVRNILTDIFNEFKYAIGCFSLCCNSELVATLCYSGQCVGPLSSSTPVRDVVSAARYLSRLPLESNGKLPSE